MEHSKTWSQHSRPHYQLPMRDAFSAPDTDDWTAAMDAGINNVRRLNLFKGVSRSIDRNIITPRWVLHRKFENGTLVKHKARLVRRRLKAAQLHMLEMWEQVVPWARMPQYEGWQKHQETYGDQPQKNLRQQQTQSY
jgi:hypothetical protein